MSVRQSTTTAPSTAEPQAIPTQRSARRLWLAGVIAAAGVLAALAWAKPASSPS